MYTTYKNALETKIKASVGAIKTIDYYNRQYERYEDLKAIKFPACYIEFERPITWRTEGDGLQTADTFIKVHLVVLDLKDNPEAALSLGKETFKKLHLKRLMDGAEQLSTELVRKTSELVDDFDQLKVVIIQFNTTLYDTTTLKRYIGVNPDFNLTRRT